MFAGVARNKPRDQRLTEIQELQQRILEQTAASETAKSAIKSENALSKTKRPSTSHTATLDEVLFSH